MKKTIGVLAVEHIASAVVDETGAAGPIRIAATTDDALQGLPAEAIAETIGAEIRELSRGQDISAVGIAIPGMNKDGLILESPNLQQLKGVQLAGLIDAPAPVMLFNDADAMAAGIAAMRGQLDRLIRVWLLGSGVGFGRYPWIEGVWEGGHSVVTLDPKEQFCGCGGTGHLEGILGHRAMRLRFLDLEPDEVFANAVEGDARCRSFFKFAHRALAAATATSVHMEGPGKFFIAGPNARFIDLGLLNMYLHEMVKMSPLQGTLFELVSMTDEVGVIGAAVNARLTANFNHRTTAA